MARTFFMEFNRLDEAETEIAVEYTFSPGAPATWDDPAEGAEVEIVQAFTERDGKVELTDEEAEKFSQYIAENHEDDGDDY